MTSNVPQLLASADYAIPLYSVAPTIEPSPFVIHLVVRPMAVPSRSIPANLFDHIQYTGFGDWLTMHLGPLGLCQVNLASKRAWIILASELADRPELVSRYLLNTILTNFLIASGYGFLHATGLLKGQKVLLLMAPHNAGKSTMALHLTLAGYSLLSDSMILIGRQGTTEQLYGFPVGRLKLRSDMIADFPQLEHLLETEPARGEIKYAIDLRNFDPGLVQESVVQPTRVCLCLLSRSDTTKSHLRPAKLHEVMNSVMANSLFYDTEEVWKQNLAFIRLLVEKAHYHHLEVGSAPTRLVTVVDALWTSI